MNLKDLEARIKKYPHTAPKLLRAYLPKMLGSLYDPDLDEKRLYESLIRKNSVSDAISAFCQHPEMIEMLAMHDAYDELVDYSEYITDDFVSPEREILIYRGVQRGLFGTSEKPLPAKLVDVLDSRAAIDLDLALTEPGLRCIMPARFWWAAHNGTISFGEAQEFITENRRERSMQDLHRLAMGEEDVDEALLVEGASKGWYSPEALAMAAWQSMAYNQRSISLAARLFMPKSSE